MTALLVFLAGCFIGAGVMLLLHWLEALDVRLDREWRESHESEPFVWTDEAGGVRVTVLGRRFGDGRIVIEALDVEGVEAT